MFCSTIIPTVNRPSLAKAVCSVLEQEFQQNDFEVIVVNDSGETLVEAEWLKSDRLLVIDTNQRERSVARNAGASVARGKYLHFLDDDDWMLPGALESFHELAKSSSACWLSGGYRLVDSNGSIIREFRIEESGNCLIQMIAGEWLPLQASFIEAESFFSVGGFAPLPSLLGGSEDIHIQRELARNYDFDAMDQIVAAIRRNLEESTTHYANFRQQNRQSREITLRHPGVLNRMADSARDSQPEDAYWFGKIAWFYLASFRWNLGQKNLFTAISRVVGFLTALFRANSRIFLVEFWRGALKPYHPRAFRDLPSIDSND